jgi:Na+-transporting methylmalonyl-CoA/oxaloacetate decarboxylase gamma subunit
MVSFDQHIILPAGTEFYIGVLILVLFLLVVAILFVGMMVYQLSIVIQRQSEMLGVDDDRAQARKVERKKL